MCFAQCSLWVLQVCVSLFLSTYNYLLFTKTILLVECHKWLFLCSPYFPFPAGGRTAAPWTSRWRRQARSQSRSLAKSASLWVAPTPLLPVFCSGRHTTAIFVCFFLSLMHRHMYVISSALSNNQKPCSTDTHYMSFQVIKGLSYLREKHKIMHRGHSFFFINYKMLGI